VTEVPWVTEAGATVTAVVVAVREPLTVSVVEPLDPE
jgi:hypothetical protein